MLHKGRLSTLAKVLLYCQFLCSNVVWFEPAPFDVLFIFTMAVFWSKGYFRIDQKLRPTFLLLGVFLLLSLFSMMAVMDIVRGVQYLGITCYLILLFIFIASVRLDLMEEVILLIFSACTASALLFTGLALLDFYNVLPLSALISVSFAGDRLQGFFKDPNVFGPTIAFSLLYLLYILNQRGNSLRHSFVALTGASILVLAVFLSYSRAAWVGTLLGIGIYYLLMLIQRRFRINAPQIMWHGILLGCIIVGFAVLVLRDPAFLKLFYERLHLQGYDTDRFLVQHMLMEKSIQHPFGIGTGQVEVYMSEYFGDTLASNATHNGYLRVWVENGLLALSCFIGFLLSSLWLGIKLSLRHWRYAELSAVAVAVLFGYAVESFVIDTIHWRQLWITFGIIWALGMVCAAYDRDRSSV